MGATTGIVPIGTYNSGTLKSRIQNFLNLLPNPDASHGTGSVAGSGQTPRVGAGFLDEMSPGAAAALRVELTSLLDGVDAGGDDVAFGQYTVTAGDATANLVNIVTGLADLSLADLAVTVTRSGSIVTADAAITEPTPGTIRVADGSTYNTTAGDVITWFARDPSA